MRNYTYNELEVEIKRIKSRLNTTNNFHEHKQLKKQLQRMQKEKFTYLHYKGVKK